MITLMWDVGPSLLLCRQGTQGKAAMYLQLSLCSLSPLRARINSLLRLTCFAPNSAQRPTNMLHLLSHSDVNTVQIDVTPSQEAGHCCSRCWYHSSWRRHYHVCPDEPRPAHQYVFLSAPAALADNDRAWPPPGVWTEPRSKSKKVLIVFFSCNSHN